MKFNAPITVMRASRREYTDREGVKRELHEAVVLSPEDELMTIGCTPGAFAMIADLKNVRGNASLEVGTSESRGRAFVQITQFVQE